MSYVMSEEAKQIDPNCPVHGEDSQDFDEVMDETTSATLTVGQVVTLSRRLEGKLLTICDAIVSGDRQNKAMKDLVKDTLREFRFRVEAVSGNAGDEFSVGVATTDIEETEQGFKIPAMFPPKEEA